jgi:SAM-dependent methyltransferase
VLDSVLSRMYALKMKKLYNYQDYLELFIGLSGLEIGGPSVFFQRSLPIYKVVKNLDCVNFQTRTLWQGNLEQGNNYRYYKNKTGYQYICDAVSMEGIETGKYDFCLSCNVLEHIANPLKAISEWLRVINENGLLLLVVPRKESNFDHNRPTTTFDHLKKDYDSKVCEDDLTHIEEIMRLHDLRLDRPAGTYEQFKSRSLNNLENRALHQHVFDMDLLEKTFQFFNLKVLAESTVRTDYVILGKKQNPELTKT